LASILLRRRGTTIPKNAVDIWLEQHATAVQNFKAMLDEMKQRHVVDFATLSVAQQELRKLSTE